MCYEEVKKRRSKSPEQALNALMRECAKGEKSTGDARRLLSRWEVSKESHDEIIDKLKEQKFIDNRRFASAYVRDKLNLSGWGASRIRLELGRKGVEREIIDEVVGDLDREIMCERLCKVMSKRAKSTKYKDKYELKGKLLRYGASLGYEYSMVSDVITQIVNNEKEEDECYDF